MPGGRPTKYDPKLCKKVDDYLETCVDEESTFHKTVGEKSDSYDRILTVKLPTLEGFAIYLGIVTSTLHLWANEHPEFSESLEKIKQEQKKRLIEKGISGDYNSTIAKLILSSNHGMTERQDITTGGDKMFDAESTEKAKAAVKGIIPKGDN